MESATLDSGFRVALAAFVSVVDLNSDFGVQLREIGTKLAVVDNDF